MGQRMAQKRPAAPLPLCIGPHIKSADLSIRANTLRSPPRVRQSDKSFDLADKDLLAIRAKHGPKRLCRQLCQPIVRKMGIDAMFEVSAQPDLNRQSGRRRGLSLGGSFRL